MHSSNFDHGYIATSGDLEQSILKLRMVLTLHAWMPRLQLAHLATTHLDYRIQWSHTWPCVTNYIFFQFVSFHAPAQLTKDTLQQVTAWRNLGSRRAWSLHHMLAHLSPNLPTLPWHTSIIKDGSSHTWPSCMGYMSFTSLVVTCNSKQSWDLNFTPFVLTIEREQCEQLPSNLVSNSYN